PVKRYLFSAQRELSLVVEVVSDLPDGGIALILRDAQGSTLATARASMLGGAFLIPAATGVQYELVVIHSGAERREPYTLSLRPYQSAQTLVITPWQPTQTATESISQNTPTRTANAFASFTPTPVETRVEIDTPAASATQLPPITPSAPASTATEFTPVELPAFGDCIATPAGARGVNVRRGPGTEYEITSGLNPGEVMPVTGHSEAFDWWQVEYREGTYGWVADIAVQVGGDCSTIGVAPYPTQESISSVTAVPLATEEGDLAE
ncbi:MAG TPA: SH3 domain-containing protein, partial [Aggregatilineales bacterium]|nr:SH3 domain-containing protein [Aggregatilineales bacterium]